MVTQVSSTTVEVPKADSSLQSAGKERHFRALGRNVLLKNISETSRLFQMAFFVVIARRYGPAALGNLTVLLMIGSGVGLLIGDLGINTTTIARMGGSTKSEQREIVSQALFWKGVLCLVALVVMCSGMYVTKRSGTPLEIVWVALISLGVLWMEFLSALTNGVNRLDAEAWLRIVYRGVVYGGGAIVAYFVDLPGDMAYMAISTLAVVAVAFVLLEKRLVSLKICVPQNASLLWESVPVWVTQLAQLTYLKLDVVILGLLHVAAQETGWYAAAWKIADVLTALPSLLSAAALPLICGALPETNVFTIAPKYLKTMYILPFLFVLPLSIGAEWITGLLYGNGFVGTPRVLQILIWAIVPIFVHSFLVIVALATHRQSEAAKFAAATSILGILAAVFLVPQLGYQAMAVICLVANSIFASVMVYRFRNVTASTQWGVFLKCLGSALGIYGFCVVAHRALHPLLLILGGTMAYCVALLIVGVVSLRSVSQAWQFIGSLFWNRPADGVNLV